ncbi:MAG: hypothetical protein CR989_02080 [Flavobacteriales bacterium]|nr:MAG: hypothetical protein CR989_02080 [Flavobacteriales bacterium]
MSAVKNMNKYALIKEIHSVPNQQREGLKKISKAISKDQSLFEPLVEIAFDYDNDISIKAIITLEIIVEQHTDWIAYKLAYFTQNISKLKSESAIKSAAKICNLIAKEYTSKYDSPIKLLATHEQISEIIETCFDWLLSKDLKHGIKANAMEALFHLGKKINWVHYELKLILEKSIENSFNAFTNRAKKILALIEKQPIN